jgi:quercetin dioxygenase-like cupin family protein
MSGVSNAVTLFCWDDIPEEPLNELLSRRLITGNRAMLAHVYLKKGCIVPRHFHENEQFSYMLRGTLKFFLDGAELLVREGDVLHIPSNVPHEAHALEDSLSLDVFCPPREDWLQKTDAYLRGPQRPRT